MLQLILKKRKEKCLTIKIIKNTDNNWNCKKSKHK